MNKSAKWHLFNAPFRWHPIGWARRRLGEREVLSPNRIGLCQLQPMPSSFFSGRTGSAHLSLKLTKAPATRLLQQTYWMAFAICSFWTGCKQSTLAPPPAPPPVTVATPIRKEVVEWDEYTGRTEAVESVEVRRASPEGELEKIGG